MSQENVEIVRHLYDAVAAGDAEAVIAFYDPKVVYDFSRSPNPLLQAVYRGHEGLRAFFREWSEAWEEVEDNCEELIEAGDQVISVVTTRGRGRVSGVEVEQTHHGVWTIHSGKIVNVTWVGTRDEALEAVGLRE